MKPYIKKGSTFGCPHCGEIMFRAKVDIFPGDRMDMVGQFENVMSFGDLEVLRCRRCHKKPGFAYRANENWNQPTEEIA